MEVIKWDVGSNELKKTLRENYTNISISDFYDQFSETHWRLKDFLNIEFFSLNYN